MAGVVADRVSRAGDRSEPRRTGRKRLARSPLLVVLGSLLACYLALPLGAFVVRLGGSATGFSTPGLWSALVISLTTATISTALITLVGLPLAYVLSRSSHPLATAVGVITQLPLAL